MSSLSVVEKWYVRVDTGNVNDTVNIILLHKSLLLLIMSAGMGLP